MITIMTGQKSVPNQSNKHNAMISEDDLHRVIRIPNARRLKAVQLVMVKPQHFGLDRWEPHFTLPDKWMKKIYRKDSYIDTDCPSPDCSENITEEQRKMLNDYVTKNVLRDGKASVQTRLRPQATVDKLVDFMFNDEQRSKKQSKRPSKIDPLPKSHPLQPPDPDDDLMDLV